MVSPGQQRRLARLRAEATALGMTIEQWRQMRAADSSRKEEARAYLARGHAADTRFRLAHAQACYDPGVLGYIHHYVDAAMVGMQRAFEDHLLRGGA